MHACESVVVACWAVLVLFWLVSALFVKKNMTRGHYGSVILWRLVLVAAIIAFVKLDRAGARASYDLLVRRWFSFTTIGSVVTVLGLLVAVWARATIGRNWSSLVTYKEDPELVTSGPYGYVRHPIYAGIILMFVGTLLAYGMLLLFLVVTGATVYLLRRTGKEEALMHELFGKEYEAYVERTKRLVPWML